MSERVQAALALWGLEAGTARPAALRENEVWKVEHSGRAYALRLHRVGYRTLDELRSEPFEKFTFSPQSAAVYQLGQWGTAAKKLKELEVER